MDKKEYREFLYLEKSNYDKELIIKGKKLRAYSKKKINRLFPRKNYKILGETFAKKKHNKKKDIGKIEFGKKHLYVTENGGCGRLFKKQSAFVAVEGGGYISILKTRLLPIILIIVLLLGLILGGLYITLKEKPDDKGEGEIKPVVSDLLTITGVVSQNGEGFENASLSLQYGNKEIAAATTDAEGKYLINDVKNGNYNLVCSYGNSTLTKSAFVCGSSIIIDFEFDALVGEDTSVRAIVKITNDKTPAVSVDGHSEEAMYYVEQGKEMDLTFLATLLTGSEIPEEDKAEIEAICGELEMTYYDFSVLKEIFKDNILESSEYLTKTKTVLEVAVPFDSTHSVATYVFRYHGDTALKFEALAEKPTSDYKDGTYFVASDVVYVYTDCFSTYAIGAANTEQVVRGSDTITYSSNATLNLNTNVINILYKHDADSTNDARVEIYLVGTKENLLIAQSGTVPVGYQIESISLIEGISGLPSVGTYEGLMKIIYLNTDGGVSTNVDIPLTVAITK